MTTKPNTNATIFWLSFIIAIIVFLILVPGVLGGLQSISYAVHGPMIFNGSDPPLTIAGALLIALIFWVIIYYFLRYVYDYAINYSASLMTGKK